MTMTMVMVGVLVQQVRLVIDHCDSASVLDADGAARREDRRPCEALGETPGDRANVDAALPLQLGGRIAPDADYPRHVTRHSFSGCVKNLIHNGQVEELRSLRYRGVVGRVRGGTASPLPHFFGLKFVQKLVHCCNWLLTETQCKMISVQQN